MCCIAVTAKFPPVSTENGSLSNLIINRMLNSPSQEAVDFPSLPKEMSPWRFFHPCSVTSYQVDSYDEKCHSVKPTLTTKTASYSMSNRSGCLGVLICLWCSVMVKVTSGYVAKNWEKRGFGKRDWSWCTYRLLLLLWSSEMILVK